MKIHGYTISELSKDGDGQTLRRIQCPPAAMQIATTLVNLQFTLELLSLFSYDDKGRTEKFTRDYRDWMDLARQRFTLDWDKSKLNRAKKWAIKTGLLIEKENGDFQININVIPDTVIEQRDRSKPAKAETASTTTDLSADSQMAAKPDKTIKRLPESQAKPFTPEKPTEAPKEVELEAPKKVEKVFTQDEKEEFHRLCVEHEFAWPEDTVDEVWANRERLSEGLRRYNVRSGKI